MNRRALTPGEMHILELIRDHYGPRNTCNEVFFTDENEAAIFIKARDGSVPGMANLSNLAAWRADGSISSEEELKRKWLRISSGP